MSNFAVKKDNRLEVPLALTRTGVEDNNGFPLDYFNQAIYELGTDWVLGTAAQVALGDANISSNAGTLEDADSVTIVLKNDDRIKIVYDVALTANLVIDGGGKRLDIKTDRGLTMLLGADAGNSNVPFKIQLLNADKSKVDIYTDKDFNEVISVKAAATRSDKSVFSNQTLGSEVKLNGRKIFGRNRSESLISKTLDPYSIHLDGSNDLEQIEYKDLFGFIGFSSTLGLDAAITSDLFSVPNYLGRVERSGNGSSTVSTDQHSRAGIANFTQWPNTSTSISCGLISGTNTIAVDVTADGTQADNELFLQNCIGLRCKSASNSIPYEGSGTPSTSIIQSVDISTPSAVILGLIDSVTGSDADATATATENLTISNTGDCLGSLEVDQMQGSQTGIFEDSRTFYGYGRGVDQVNASAGARTDESLISYKTTSQGITNGVYPVSDGTNDTPRIGKQTKMINILTFKYFLC
jgi:hypothetical protein